MDHEETGPNLGLVQVTQDLDQDEVGPELTEEIDRVTNKYVEMLPPDLRRAFENDMEGIRTTASLKDFDPVTGLLNRRAAGSKYLKIIGRHRSPEIGIIFADVDDFKQINSKFTRPGGDQVLRSIGRILQHQARVEDIIMGRLGDGADEFLAIVTNLPRATRDFARMVYRIAEALNSPEVQTSAGYNFDHPLRISLSCARISLSGRDRRVFAPKLCEGIYRKLSQAVDEAKLQRKHLSELGAGNEPLIPMLKLVTHKADVLQSGSTYLARITPETKSPETDSESAS